MPAQNKIWTPFQLNSQITLKNRIIMAPMTRAKATDELEPTDIMAEYYARRADAGLIITEGTIIERDSLGYKNVPGIYTQQQIEKWKNATQKVHSNGGLIFMQIWHVGRVSHPSLIGGKLPISASETEMTGKLSRSDLRYGKSRAATSEEIHKITSQYAMAAKNAMEAGFDGVEIHGANGYLIDQFLHHHTNKRTDNYGGSPENNSRFALEVVKACGEMIGFERVGIRLSPGAYLNEIEGVKEDSEVFKYLLKELNKFPLAYVHSGNFNDSVKFPELNDKTMGQFLRENYVGTLIACGSYSFETAKEAMEENKFNLIAMGRPFIANPNLIHRLQNNIELEKYDVKMLDTLY